LKKQETEEARRKQEALIQQEEFMKNQQNQQRQQYINALQQYNIPSSSLDLLEEMGMVKTHGIGKVVGLLIINRGNIESTMEALCQN